MNTISSNSSYTYRSRQQEDKQPHVRNRNGNLGSTEDQFYEDVQIVSTKDFGISMQEAFERMSGSSKDLLEAGQDEEYKDKSVEVSDVKRSPSLGGLCPETKITEIGVASLKDFSFYFNEDTGEVRCISHSDNRPGRHPLWSKTLSPEDRVKCDKLFDNYKDVAAGDFVYRYRAYLMHEEFWDMYLEGKVDLTTLTESDDTLSEDELYNMFLRNTVNREH
ncbi:MAG: hypothetical protein K2N77_02360 [Lachnospiraceae bacterium]|nr:hypothetical protein [Lachnospiraceae bacterium]